MMMRTIYLLRHAKSSWQNADQPDIERPLSERGYKAGKHIGQHMIRSRILPDRTLCSPALRTRQTLALILTALPDSGQIQFEPSLYHADHSAALELLREQSDKQLSLMMIGHNPTLQSLALSLAKANKDAPHNAHLDSVRNKLPTGALLSLQTRIEHWSELAIGSCELTQFTSPRDLQ